jgi:hypothetical protein
MSETHSHYLRDLGYLVREAAEKARADATSATEDDRLFQTGRSMAYYEVASLMHQQAEAFGIPLHDLAFDGFDPDRDLL